MNKRNRSHYTKSNGLVNLLSTFSLVLPPIYTLLALPLKLREKEDRQKDGRITNDEDKMRKE